MENKVYNVVGHTVEFGNGPSSLDPWTRQYARENGVSLMSTCDCREWMLVDGESLYCLRSSSPVYHFYKYLEDNAIDSEEAFQLWLDTEIAGGMSHWKAESLAASKKQIDEMKKRQDVWDSLSQDEKERQREEWKAKRAEHLDK